MSKKHKNIKPAAQQAAQTLGKMIKDDSNVLSIAIEDRIIGKRLNLTEFFDTLTHFLASWNMALIGIDKQTFLKMSKERAERMANAPEAPAEDPNKVEGDQGVIDVGALIEGSQVESSTQPTESDKTNE